MEADKLLQDDEFVQKFDTFMNTKVRIRKSKYYPELVETTLNDMLKGSVIGTVEDAPKTLYHGTTKYSYDDIIKNNFSLDAACITESGKGIYFGTDKAAAQQYCRLDGKIIEAQYTGRKIAKVTPGVVGELESCCSLKGPSEEILNIDAYSDEGKTLLRELLAKRYTKMLSDMGYDAIQATSIGARCKYIVVLDPKNIKIVS